MPRLNRSADSAIEENPQLFGSDEEPEGWWRGMFKRRKTAKGKRAVAASPWKVRLLRAGAQLGIAAMLVPLAAGGAALGGLYAWLQHAPPIREFEAYDPPEATMILDRHGKPLASLFEQRRFVVPIEQLPPQLPEAFVAIEDERFYQHFGVDPIGIARAFLTNVMRGRFSQGASTITQQTARNLLPRIGTQKSYERKIHEMLISLQMENRYSKQQILEVYLNQIYLGSGTYGVQAASLAYFGKPASELNLWQTATLAGLPQLPERYSPLNSPELAQHRRDQVLWRMLQTGAITGEEYDEAVVEKVAVENSQRTGSGRAAYFVDAVRRLLAEHPQLGGAELQTVGWRIRTTVDPVAQQIAEEVLARGLEEEEKHWLEGRQLRFAELKRQPEFERQPRPGQVRMATVEAIFDNHIVVRLPGGWRSDMTIPPATASYFVRDQNIAVGQGVDIEVVSVEKDRGLFHGRLLPSRRLQGALVCLDAETGDVRAIVGGRQYNDPANGGFFNRAMLARRQPGSTFKPFFFAAALEHGLTPMSYLNDSPIVFADGYAPKNYDKRFRGNVSMQYSLEHSRNIPTFRVIQAVGLRNALQFLARFQRFGDKPWDLPMQWSQALGTTSVTPMELASAYQPLANAGHARGPRFIQGIWNEENRETVGLREQPEEPMLSPRAHAQLVQMMMGVMTHGTGEKLLELMPESLQHRVAGKSGTTDDNRDAWFAGFTPHEVVVVFVGFDQNIPLPAERTGSKAAGTIWATYLARLWETKTPEEQQADLRLPEGYHLVAINPSTGQPVWPGTPEWIEPPFWRVVEGPKPVPPPAGAPELPLDSVPLILPDMVEEPAPEELEEEVLPVAGDEVLEESGNHQAYAN